MCKKRISLSAVSIFFTFVLGFRITSYNVCYTKLLRTGHKAKMRLPGMGIPHMKGNGCGDLYVVA